MTRPSHASKRRVFSPDQLIYARKVIVAAGRSFETREIIDWRSLGIEQKIVERWWRLKIVSHFPGGDAEQRERHRTDAIEREALAEQAMIEAVRQIPEISLDEKPSTRSRSRSGR